MQDLTKEQIIDFIKRQKILIILVGAVLLILIVLIVVFTTRPKVVTKGRTGNNQQSGAIPTKKPFDPFGLSGKEDRTEDSDNEAIATSLKNIHSGNPSAPLPSSIKNVQTNGSTTNIPLASGSITQTSQGTVNPNGNIQTGVGSNVQEDNIRIVFQNPDGTTTTYIPPGTPPDEVRWGRYTNNVGKYAINYPSNWQFIYSVNSGNEGVALYPPNVNINDPTSPYIGFGLTNSFLLPVIGNTENSLITSILVDGVSGNLYTNGPLGNSYIASVMQYSGKYFGVGASKSDATFAYVYYYMLNSLTFNIE